jgi:hypothetical protein
VSVCVCSVAVAGSYEWSSAATMLATCDVQGAVIGNDRLF